MFEFMRAGGVLMWPLLVLGFVAVMTASGFMFRSPGQGELAKNLSLAVLAASLGWSALGFFVVTQHAAAAPTEVLITGVGEAVCPAVLGLMVYAITTLIGALSVRSETSTGQCSVNVA